MITFVAGKSNTLRINMNSAVDLTGFVAYFSAFGDIKTISDLTQEEIKVEFEDSLVKEDQNGVYGILDIMDADGDLYLRFMPQFRVLPADKAQLAEGRPELTITLPTTFEYGYNPSGGGVTMEEVQKAIDDAISDIGQQTIQNEKVTAVDSEGHPVQMTLAQAVQRVVYAEEDIEGGKEKHLIGSVEDEDHDGQPDGGILYLRTEKQLNL